MVHAEIQTEIKRHRSELAFGQNMPGNMSWNRVARLSRKL